MVRSIFIRNVYRTEAGVAVHRQNDKEIWSGIFTVVPCGDPRACARHRHCLGGWGGGGGGGGITPRVTHCKWRQRSNLHLISLQLDINRPVVTGQGEKGGMYCWEEIGDHWGGVRIGSHW